MTLHTRLAVHAPVHARALFDYARSLLNVPLEEQIEAEPKPAWFDAGTLRYSNQIGQGFSAIVELDAAVERPMQHGSPYGPDDDDCWLPKRDTFAVLGWDTGYSYMVEGAGCGDLHAHFIREVGTWLDERGLPWSWYNEFEGTWNDPDVMDLGDASKVNPALIGRDLTE